MLSILIPTYNYNVLPLVQELHRQANDLNCVFEVLVYDDASPHSVIENHKITTLSNCNYKILPKNIGRSAIRNLLAKDATYENLLFLDADVSIFNNDFIKNYLEVIAVQTYEVVYGGIVYQKTRPSSNQLLRWIYGNEREALTASQRSQNLYVSFLTLNFLIKKSVFEKVSFDENIPNLRYEDLLFSYHLKQQKIKLNHIDNQVIHDGIETSEVFLSKTDDSLKGLKFLLDHQLLPYEYAKISKKYIWLQKTGLYTIVNAKHQLFKKIYIKNLLSESPSLFIYDIYRLGLLTTL